MENDQRVLDHFGALVVTFAMLRCVINCPIIIIIIIITLILDSGTKRRITQPPPTICRC